MPLGGADATAARLAEARLAEARLAETIPPAVHGLLTTLWRAGHAAYVVGGALRDALAGRPISGDDPPDWDLATSALPEQTVGLFERAVYENRFGTVAIRTGADEFEITTFRSDHDYADFRRPHRVEFGSSLEDDLARRDFTMNALAWGAAPAPASSLADPRPRLVDPFDGRADIAAGRIRAVGEPRKRFEEDALRIVRAIRFAATLGWTIDPETLAAVRQTAPLVAHLSGERIAMELEKLLRAVRPSVGLGLLADTGVLATISADLAAQQGVAQNKTRGEDLWAHTLRTVDAAPVDRDDANLTIVRWAALLHDIGKPATAADGHFYRHEAVGADLADGLLERLRLPTSTRTRVVHLVRQHMFRYEAAWGDAAVRRFLAKIGPDAIDQLFALREADNVGSGVPHDADDLDGLRARIAAELAAGPILDRSALAIDGSDLMAELGLAEGPELGRLLLALFDRVVENPSLNERSQLLEVARVLTTRSGSAGDPPAAALSVQLYAVRAALAEDADATLGRLAALGFRRVEPFDLAVYRRELAAGLRRHGLTAPTAHVGLLGQADLDTILDAAVELGVGTVIQPWTEPARWQTAAGVREVAAELDAVANRAARRGVRVGYHNHHFELASIIDGRHALELFAELVAPEVVLEVDTYWAHAGGADVPVLLRRLGARVHALHVKDGDGGLDPSTQVAVGSGTLPIAEIVAAAPAAIRVIELDDTAGDMFDAIRASRAFILALDAGPA
jgi:putative nucleotidyltransferase with HDIG domain